MIGFPDELWKLIKTFLFDWRKIHIRKNKLVLKQLTSTRFCKETYERWVSFPPFPTTNHIIAYENYRLNYWACPLPDLPLTSITWNITGNGGWRAGYGWSRNNNKTINKLY